MDPQPIVDFSQLVPRHAYYLKIRGKFSEVEDHGEILLKGRYLTTPAHSFSIERIVATQNVDRNYSFDSDAMGIVFARDDNLQDLTIGKLVRAGHQIAVSPASIEAGIVEITARRPIEVSPEDDPTVELFLDQFADYHILVRFLESSLSMISPVEYEIYYRHLSPLDFTTRAPTGHSFMEINEETTISRELLGLQEGPESYPILDSGTPFFYALKYIFSRTNHFSPETVREGN